MIYYDVEIGEHTLIGDGASIREQCRIGAYCIVGRYIPINYNTSVGKKTKIMDLPHVTGNCTIGNEVLITMMITTKNDNALGAKGYIRILGSAFVFLDARVSPRFLPAHHLFA